MLPNFGKITDINIIFETSIRALQNAQEYKPTFVRKWRTYFLSAFENFCLFSIFTANINKYNTCT